jgi:hypothetical protein
LHGIWEKVQIQHECLNQTWVRSLRNLFCHFGSVHFYLSYNCFLFSLFFSWQYNHYFSWSAVKSSTITHSAFFSIIPNKKSFIILHQKVLVVTGIRFYPLESKLLLDSALIRAPRFTLFIIFLLVLLYVLRRLFSVSLSPCRWEYYLTIA